MFYYYNSRLYWPTIFQLENPPTSSLPGSIRTSDLRETRSLTPIPTAEAAVHTAVVRADIIQAVRVIRRRKPVI